jgi:uncharacterized protein with PhoU and TrkA domain
MVKSLLRHLQAMPPLPLVMLFSGIGLQNAPTKEAPKTMFDFAKIGQAGQVMADAATDIAAQLREANDHLKMIEAYMAEIHETVSLYNRSQNMSASEITREIERANLDG